MENKEIRIEYLTHTTGGDLEGVEEFKNNINKEYNLTIEKKRIEVLCGGVYELIIEITEDITLMELAKSYAEDAFKFYIGYKFKVIFKNIKSLFIKNEKNFPTVEKIKIKFKDCTVTIYEIYVNGVEENFEEIVSELIKFGSQNKKLLCKTQEIHIPIFNKKDNYKICKYRVKLESHETIKKFQKNDYQSYWGIQTNKKHKVYNLKKNKIRNKIFYTQETYDKLFFSVPRRKP